MPINKKKKYPSDHGEIKFNWENTCIFLKIFKKAKEKQGGEKVMTWSVWEEDQGFFLKEFENWFSVIWQLEWIENVHLFRGQQDWAGSSGCRKLCWWIWGKSQQ